ncbi:MAG: HEAT repeat domain-containing protein, partial [Planctomycetales bacterium]|nr:HEAT repeat domain-containing protein [Planctomycetales bacterium]
MAARCRFRDWLPAASIALAVACCLCIAASAAADEPASAVPALMKLLESGRLPEQRLPAVMEMVCNRGNTRDLQVVWDWLGTPDRMSPELQRKVLDWLTDAAVTRKVRPDGDLSLINRWISVDVGHEHPELQEAAIRLAAAWTDKSVVPQLRDLAFAGDTSAEMRTTAIAGLSAIDDVTSQKALRLLARDHPSNLAKMQAISGITAFDLTAAAAAAAAVMSQGKLTQVELDQGLGDMIDAFLQRPAGPTHLAEALQTSRLSKDVAKSALRYMYSVGRSDAVLSDVLSVAAGIQVDSPPPTAEEIGRIVAEV